MSNGLYHNENGRFKAGNPGGGRKPRKTEEEVKRALEKAKPEADVLQKLAEAIDGRESWAISLYLAYKWGKPIERAEFSGANGESLNVFVQWDNAKPNGNAADAA